MSTDVCFWLGFGCRGCKVLLQSYRRRQEVSQNRVWMHASWLLHGWTVCPQAGFLIFLGLVLHLWHWSDNGDHFIELREELSEVILVEHFKMCMVGSRNAIKCWFYCNVPCYNPVIFNSCLLSWIYNHFLDARPKVVHWASIEGCLKTIWEQDIFQCSTKSSKIVTNS